jgi:dihydrolipoamide dehydrogenase
MPAVPSPSPRVPAGSLIDEDRQVLIGATITATGVAESLHAATIAVVTEVPLRRLRHAIPAFPTRSEIWLGLFTALGL